MKRTVLTLALGLAAAASSLGCTVKTVDAPVTVSTKLLPELSKPEVTSAAREVTGSSCSRVVLGFIPVGIATAEAAYADALAQAPGADTLISYEERANVLVAFIFYYQVCTEVHGYAVSSRALAGAR
ncbi:MAG: hypothetical protein KC657_32230 [Myxococcales bacterium]|nr:hypothetical protein [Myxococcales bacterium]